MDKVTTSDGLDLAVRQWPCAGARGQVLLVHGLEDDTVPVDEARQIHAARSSDAVELLLVPGSHDDYGDVTRHLVQLGDFLDRSMARG